MMIEKVGERIREARHKAGLSLVGLAEKSGLDKSRLSAIENGKANPTVATLERIAEALGVGVKRLFE